MRSIEGFLITRQNIDTDNGITLRFWFATPSGAVCVSQETQEAVFFIEEPDHLKADKICGELTANQKLLDLKSFNQHRVFAYYFNKLAHLRKSARLLKDQGIEALEYDVRTVDRYLMERFITADTIITTQDTQISKHLSNARLLSPIHPKQKHAWQNYTPSFTLLSFDIETNYKTNDILSIAVHSTQGGDVLMLATSEHNEKRNDYRLHFFNHEKRLIQAFLKLIQDYDPDILIGWNCINFDLRVLQQACDKLGIDFTLGRDRQTIEWRNSPNNPNHFFTLVPGRAVLDGIDTLKSATYSFESFSLESVAQEVLGTGKLIHDPDDRGEEIIRLFEQDKLALANYNFEDCVLVTRVFEALQLIEFATERARLTGLPIDKVGGSVMAFENQYLPRLHRLGYVAPNIPDNPVGVGSPGGYVMNSQPGFYQNVLVLDFKSLYPSIIRSFKIDPYGLTEGDRCLLSEKQDHLSNYPDDEHFEQMPYHTELYSRGFRGAFFKRKDNILPDLISQLWQARDKAKKENRSAMSQAIKIIMNSFYGVMGTPGCRFFDRRLPSSITLRGHEIMNQTSELIENRGYKVIYGDTDSIFVKLPDELSRSPDTIGQELAHYINHWWKTHLSKHYQLDSALELEFESHFSRFLMPTIRGSDKGSKKRYAGLKISDNFCIDSPESDTYELVFKGLETVRTDWTQLARSFQKELYRRVFLSLEYKSYIRQTVEQLKSGEFDPQLVFRKRLRRNLDDYQTNVPPHAQAAKKADHYLLNSGRKARYQYGGWISYCYTLNGPEPIENITSRLDYDLYIERQIVPIVDSILIFFGTTFDDICSNQLKLI